MIDEKADGQEMIAIGFSSAHDQSFSTILSHLYSSNMGWKELV